MAPTGAVTFEKSPSRERKDRRGGVTTAPSWRLPLARAREDSLNQSYFITTIFRVRLTPSASRR